MDTNANMNESPEGELAGFPEFHGVPVRELDTFLKKVANGIVGKYPDAQVTKAVVGLPELFIPMEGFDSATFPKIAYRFENGEIFLVLSQWNGPKRELAELYCHYSDWKETLSSYCGVVVESLGDLPHANADLHNG